MTWISLGHSSGVPPVLENGQRFDISNDNTIRAAARNLVRVEDGLFTESNLRVRNVMNHPSLGRLGSFPGLYTRMGQFFTETSDEIDRMPQTTEDERKWKAEAVL